MWKSHFSFQIFFILVCLALTYCQQLEWRCNGNVFDGSIVTVTYLDGTSESATWVATSSIAGQAQTLNWYMNQANDTFLYPWYFRVFGKGIRSILLEAEPGLVVFDLGLPRLDTPGSYSGLNYTQLSPRGNTLAIPNYSRPPSFAYGDLYFNLLLTFPNGYYPENGTLIFKIDTDNMAAFGNYICNITTVGPLEVNYIPTTDPSRSGLRNNDTLTLFLSSVVVSNRAIGVDKNLATWIYFQNATANCQPGVHYNWVYERQYRTDGCFDTYSLNINWSFAKQYCGISESISGSGKEYSGIIEIVHREYVYITRDSGIIRNTTREARSEEGFLIRLEDTVKAILSPLVTVYAPIQVTGVITLYDIPLANLDKSIYIETTIQNPQNKGFMLYLPYSPLPLIQLSGSPSIEQGLISATLTAEAGGECSTDPANAGLCVQSWLATIKILSPSVCQLRDVVLEIPYRVKCVDGVAPIQCPITSDNETAVIQIFVNTDPFCGTVIGNYTFSGTVQTFDQNFENARSSFKQNEVLSAELVVTGADANSDEDIIQSVEIIFLSGVMQSDDASEDALFPEDGLQDGVNGAHILIGGATDAGLIAQVNPNVCSLYPPCANNVLRFQFLINPQLWPVPADASRNFKLGIVVKLQFNQGKREEYRYFKLDEYSLTATTQIESTPVVPGDSNGANYTQLSYVLLFVAVLLFC
eukprot:TRINITY_DN2583_c0_g1_i1.p1 TRINITY_DN2583_c0_g1~~TRINITY_DN2583_c0_g1_i1.p1  ORF type:complete len:698 (-),score=135.51 TRINITY_DN2583_c0_g1_i1:44-2137(-)